MKQSLHIDKVNEVLERIIKPHIFALLGGFSFVAVVPIQPLIKSLNTSVHRTSE